MSGARTADGAPPLELLVQVDLAGEETKFGARPAKPHIVRAGGFAARARVTGLMLVPPWNEDPEQTRPWFVRSGPTGSAADDGVDPVRCVTSRWA